MTNAFYNTTGEPTTGAFAASSVMRAQFTLIQAGFDKLPTLTAGAVVGVNQAGTALLALSEITIGSSGDIGLGNATPFNDPGFRTVTVGDATTPGEISFANETGIPAGYIFYSETDYSGPSLAVAAALNFNLVLQSGDTFANSGTVVFRTSSNVANLVLTKNSTLIFGGGDLAGASRPALQWIGSAGTELTVTLGDTPTTATLGARSTHIYPAAAPSNPSTGWLIYCDSGDGNKLKARASTGTVVTLGTP